MPLNSVNTNMSAMAALQNLTATQSDLSTVQSRINTGLKVASAKDNAAIWAIAHRLARLVWKILHDGVRYIEQGTETNPKARKRRVQKLAQALRQLGYTVTLTALSPDAHAAKG